MEVWSWKSSSDFISMSFDMVGFCGVRVEILGPWRVECSLKVEVMRLSDVKTVERSGIAFEMER